MTQKITISMYKIILQVLHALYSVLNFLYSMWTLLCEKWRGHKTYEEELKYISRQAKNIKKLPSHVVVVMTEEKISYCDLANIIIWCVAAGISFLSFYDHDGLLKKSEFQIYSYVSDKRKEYSDAIIFGKNGKVCTSKKMNGTSNGIKNTHLLHVNFFSRSDGKGSIIDVTRDLGYMVQNGPLKSSDVTQDFLEKKMKDVLGVPDPDLALMVGKVFCTFGLLPWQIKLTEFLHVPTHHHINVRDFVNLLRTYGKCEQRFGK